MGKYLSPKEVAKLTSQLRAETAICGLLSFILGALVVIVFT